MLILREKNLVWTHDSKVWERSKNTLDVIAEWAKGMESFSSSTLALVTVALRKK